MAYQSPRPSWKELAIGSAVVEPGASRNNRTGDWRSSRPIWKLEQCVKCGVCTISCPEGCIHMRTDSYPEADLNFCKGCGICTHECVTACIRLVDEED